MFNACRSKKLPWDDLKLVLPEVASLNRKALEIGLNFHIHSCTDVTGFGILGHSLEMAKGSHVQMDLFYDQIPLYPNALQMYLKGQTTGSNEANRRLVEGLFKKIKPLSRAEEELLFDPQTSGGLLFSVPKSDAGSLVRELKNAGIGAASQVGEVVATSQPCIRVL
ncbi:MAG: AIR synthase-related protein [Candidatus Methanoperedens sp.]|nr:AIR synthase-related protein [Candidatus Methanoperedens sp.]